MSDEVKQLLDTLNDEEARIVARFFRWLAVRPRMNDEGRIACAAAYGVLNTFGFNRSVKILFTLWRKHAKTGKEKRGLS